MDSDVANEIGTTWEAEEIPNEDFLFMRVHHSYLDDDGESIPGAFRNQPPKIGGMSTDWQKYSTPEHTIARARQPKIGRASCREREKRTEDAVRVEKKNM